MNDTRKEMANCVGTYRTLHLSKRETTGRDRKKIKVGTTMLLFYNIAGQSLNLQTNYCIL